MFFETLIFCVITSVILWRPHSYLSDVRKFHKYLPTSGTSHLLSICSGDFTITFLIYILWCLHDYLSAALGYFTMTSMILWEISQLPLCCSEDFIITFWYILTLWRLHNYFSDALETLYTFLMLALDTLQLLLWYCVDFTVTSWLRWRLHNYFSYTADTSQLPLGCSGGLKCSVSFYNYLYMSDALETSQLTCLMLWRLHNYLSGALETSQLPVWCSGYFTITCLMLWRLYNYLSDALETSQLPVWCSGDFIITPGEFSVTSLMLCRLTLHLLHEWATCIFPVNKQFTHGILFLFHQVTVIPRWAGTSIKQHFLHMSSSGNLASEFCYISHLLGSDTSIL